MTTTPPKPGIYPGVPFADYVAWDAVNHHALWRLKMESPAHAIWERHHGTEETEALAFGALTDFILLEPARFAEQAVIEPEIGDGLAPKRPTARQINAKKPSAESMAAIEYWRCWDAENAGKLIVTRSDYTKVMTIAKQVRSMQSHEYICGGRSQVCLVWEDKTTGLTCKGRLDYERMAGWNHIITDLKTVRSAKQSRFAWAIWEYGYYMQMAFYADGWQTLTGDESLCVWLAVEKHGQCLCKIWEADGNTLAAGRYAYENAIREWATCAKQNTWPGYGGAELISLAPWQLEQCGIGKYTEPERGSDGNFRYEPETSTTADNAGETDADAWPTGPIAD